MSVNLFQILEENHSFNRKLESYTDSELNKLISLFPDLDLHRTLRIRSFINMYIKEKKITITKHEDEWYLVKIRGKYAMYKDVLCDQFDGLVYFINSLINTNLLDDLFLGYSFSYNDYIAENLDRNISYSEYISENTYLNTSEYIAENLDINISYAEYIACNIDR